MFTHPHPSSEGELDHARVGLLIFVPPGVVFREERPPNGFLVAEQLQALGRCPKLHSSHGHLPVAEVLHEIFLLENFALLLQGVKALLLGIKPLGVIMQEPVDHQARNPKHRYRRHHAPDDLCPTAHDETCKLLPCEIITAKKK